MSGRGEQRPKRFEGVMIPPPSAVVSDEVLRDRWGMQAVAMRRRAEELAVSGKTIALYGEVYHSMAWLIHQGHALTDKNITSKADRYARQRERLAKLYGGDST